MKTIVHVIDSLHRGGAESLLIDLLPQLKKHYNIVLVTLNSTNQFGEEVFSHCHKYYCLNHKSPLILLTVWKLKKIITKHKPILVRSQLIWSSIIARLACPKETPLVFSFHTTTDLFREDIKTKTLGWLEKLTLRKYHIMIGVTRTVVHDYQKAFNFRGKTYVLYNYVRDQFFNNCKQSTDIQQQVRLIAVGNLKTEKNYDYLIEAFKQLKDYNISLDVYGDGFLKDSLSNQIKESNVAINLKGKVKDVSKLMCQYHAFVMVSSFEGFGISVAEAMASELPLILSNIPVFHEITNNNAFFVDLSAPASFVETIKDIYNNNGFTRYNEANKRIAEENYSQKVYLSNLLNIYNETIALKSNHNQLNKN